jgi:hypothetical protein
MSRRLQFSPRLALSRMSSGHMQLSSYIRVCEGKPNSPRTLTGVRTVLSRRPNGCTGMLESSRTLKSIRTCCHDVRTDATLNYSKLLDIDESPDSITTISERMLLTDERPNTLLGRSDGNKGSYFFELESAQNLPKILK